MLQAYGVFDLHRVFTTRALWVWGGQLTPLDTMKSAGATWLGDVSGRLISEWKTRRDDAKQAHDHEYLSKRGFVKDMRSKRALH